MQELLVKENDVTTTQLARRLLKLSKQLIQEIGEKVRNAVDLIINHEQLEILAIVYQNPGVSEKDIASSKDMEIDMLREVMRQLEQYGLVQYLTNDDTTGNLPSYYLTANGQMVVRDIKNQQHTTIVNVFSELPLDEQVKIVQMLERAINSNDKSDKQREIR